MIDDLIFDIGASEGNDTDFYLRKGFRVVSVEADPAMCAKMRQRFASAIAGGRLQIVNRAAFSRAAEQIRFSIDSDKQGHSAIAGSHHRQQNGTVIEIETTDWRELTHAHGVPYFCKIDVENAEVPFLQSVVGETDLPEFFSSEVHSFAPVELFRDTGYTKFRLINQAMHSRFPIPNPPLEGVYATHNFAHSSGLFGKELPGDQWLSFDETRELWATIKRLRERQTIFNGWIDCHATR